VQLMFQLRDITHIAKIIVMIKFTILKISVTVTIQSRYS
jgi:hypothetical protein